MSRRRRLFATQLAPAVVELACRDALTALNWRELDSEPGLLRAGEDIAGLPCHNQPAQATFEISSESAQTELALQVYVPGFGPVSSQHAQRCQDGLVAMIEKKLRGRSMPARANA